MMLVVLLCMVSAGGRRFVFAHRYVFKIVRVPLPRAIRPLRLRLHDDESADDVDVVVLLRAS